ncbi:hypothetical protein GGF46_005072 [Coemansia sp. RSA 552]|nr:hypothetical protein GGF46_005072 [Coemansia sp. RSA 552]
MLQRDLPAYILCTPKQDALDRYDAQLDGPADTPYAGGRFLVDVALSERYPIDPPSIKFRTRIYHPNIDDHGNICLDVLKTGKNGSWSPSMTLAKVLLSLPMLLSSPNPHDPLMPEIADQMLNDHAAYIRAAAECTAKHATNPSSEPPDEDSEPAAKGAGARSLGTKRKAPEDAEDQKAARRESGGKRRLGLSRKSPSPAVDRPPPSLPPAHNKLTAMTGGARRLGLSRTSRTTRPKKQPLHLSSSGSSQSKPPQSSQPSSQAESVEVVSDQEESRSPSSPKGDKRGVLRRCTKGAKLSQILGTAKKSRSTKKSPRSLATGQPANNAEKPRDKGKGKAVEYPAPPPAGRGGGGKAAEAAVLLESHFGPLELGLPPVRVSAQRKLMRRRARNAPS